MHLRSYTYRMLAISAAVVLSGCGGGPDSETSDSTEQALHRRSILGRLTPNPTFSVTTVPPNGDLNPYGVAFVPDDFGGILRDGDILVSNFNNGQNAQNTGNLQGTGTTIVSVNRRSSTTPGQATVFYPRPGTTLRADEAGFSTALGVLSKPRWVVLGNVPSISSTLGSCTNLKTDVGQGYLTFIDNHGVKRGQLGPAAGIDGPWDLTVFNRRGHHHHDHHHHERDEGTTKAIVFVSNLGTQADSGYVLRLDLTLTEGGGFTVDSSTQIASGYAHGCDPAAFVLGPTGLAYDSVRDVLYVASTKDNAIFKVEDASTRTRAPGNHTGAVVAQNLDQFHGPLGLVRAENGNLISSQGDAVSPDPLHPSEIVEITARGTFVRQFSVNAAPGSAFGIALEETPSRSRFAAVDDTQNALDVWRF